MGQPKKHGVSPRWSKKEKKKENEKYIIDQLDIVHEHLFS